jgi:glycerophosphoryl diester phosphodiesterase
MTADTHPILLYRNTIAVLRGRVGTVVRFALAFELLRWLLLAPAGAGLLRMSLEHWGRCSVGNFEIITFLVSPPGIAALVGVGTIELTTLYLELAGLLLLLAHRQAAWWSVFPILAKRLFFILGLGLRQLVVLLALALPFGGAA